MTGPGGIPNVSRREWWIVAACFVAVLAVIGLGVYVAFFLNDA